MSGKRIKTICAGLGAAMLASLLSPLAAKAAPTPISEGAKTPGEYYNSAWEKVYLYDTAQHRIIDGPRDIGFSEENEWMSWYTYDYAIAARDAEPNMVLFSRSTYNNPLGKKIDDGEEYEELEKLGIMKQYGWSEADYDADTISDVMNLSGKVDAEYANLTDNERESILASLTSANVVKYVDMAILGQKGAFDLSPAEIGQSAYSSYLAKGRKSKKTADEGTIEKVIEKQKEGLS